MHRYRSGILQGAVLAVFTAVSASQAHAQALDANGELLEQLYALDQYLSRETNVASQRAFSARESPGVVTIFTEEEIARMGARDLTELLMFVPGFGLGVDLASVVGMGTRGIWGHEGKILLLVDGQEFNEVMFGNNPMGNRFPLDQVQRIEIIRGPGSAIYGGFAELAVIKVTTRASGNFKGTAASASYGQMARTYGHRYVTGAVGDDLGDLKVGLSWFLGQGIRSNGTYRDVNGATYDMAQNAYVRPSNMNLGLGYKELSLRLMIDEYYASQRDSYVTILPQATGNTFRSYFAEAAWEHQLAEGVRVTARLNYKRNQPWNNTDRAISEDEGLYYNTTGERLTARLSESWDINEWANLVVGGELNQDRAWVQANRPQDYFISGSRYVEYYSLAAFAESTLRLPWVNVTAGARVDDHRASGAAFVPRLALTRIFEPLHFKLLLARAYRAPAIENFDSGNEMHPELTDVAEFEVGWKMNHAFLLTANVFDLSIHDPIVFVTGQGYLNSGEMGSRGAEAELRFSHGSGYATLGYSFYTTSGKPVSDVNQVPGHDDVTLGFPTHKVTLASSVQVMDKLSVNPSAIFLGNRFAEVALTEDGVPVVEELSPSLLLNLNVMYQDAFVRGLTLTAGVNDLLDQAPPLVQPYLSDHAPMPGPSREFFVRAAWSH